MKRDLWSSKQGKPTSAAEGTQAPQNIDAQSVQDAQSAIEHYSGMNEGQLMNELLNFRQSGAMDDRSLQEMTQTVSPMLNDEQKKRLDALIRQLRQ